jgi:hypothetical protein
VEHESNQPIIECVNCKEPGHRARDCPKERFNPHACKNCKQEGHNSKECPEPRSAEGVECRKCNETGHFSKDVSICDVSHQQHSTNKHKCPSAIKRTCNNCGSEDHMSKECDQPKNSANVTCRNCEEKGHFSKECPKPRDYSKVQCQNCQEFGHTRVVSLTPQYVYKDIQVNIFAALQEPYRRGRFCRRRRCCRRRWRRWRLGYN